MDRELPKSKLIAAFSLTVLIFLLIIVMDNYFNEAKLNQLSDIYNNVRIDSLNQEVQYDVLSQNPCVALNFGPIDAELSDLGNKLTSMEESLGKNNDQVLNLKQYYSLVEIQQFLFVKRAVHQCDINSTPILFFYSNQNDCNTCDSQGFVLNYVKKMLPNAYVYSFDVNLNSSAVSALKATYNITKAPSLVINGTTYAGFMDSDVVLSILNRSS